VSHTSKTLQEAFIDALVKWQSQEQWQQLKKVEDNTVRQQIHYFIIRALAQYGNKELLKRELDEFISNYSPENNLEFSFYGSLAGIHPDKVKSLQGFFKPPSTESPDYISYKDTILNKFRMWIIAHTYEGNDKARKSLKDNFKARDSFWKSYFYYLCLAGDCLGKHLSDSQDDWLAEATEALTVLEKIEKKLEGERLFEFINVCRGEIPDSLYLLTKAILERYPERIEEWFKKIHALQDSKLWTFHYGINEYSEDYSFELNVYDKLSTIPECRKHLIGILRDCADKFKKLTHLKGETRSNHFLRLSTLASRCGYKNEANEWLKHGIQATLIYGFHKDITLFQLIDIMDMLNKHQPEKALERCSEILEMVDWMPALTDGRETHHLPSAIFRQVAKLNLKAALILLRQYSKLKAMWQSQDCMEILFEKIDDGDSELLWLLASYFVNSSTERGEYSSQTVKARNKIHEIIDKSSQAELLDEFKRRLDHFIRTNISPRLWPNLVSQYWALPDHYKVPPISEPTEPNPLNLKKDEFKLNGNQVKKEEIEALLSKSVDSYIETMIQLQEENDHFYEPEITGKALSHLISNETSTDELCKLKDHLNSEDRWTRSETFKILGDRFLDIGDTDNALECFEIAYINSTDWTRWIRQREPFVNIVKHDKQRAIRTVIEDAYQRITEYGGHSIPLSISAALDILGDVKSLEKVFNDYLTHVKELFHHIPLTDDYEWLKTFSDEKEDFNSLTISLIIDQLETPEIDHGNRLVDSLAEYCIKKPKVGLPIIFQRLKNVDGLLRHRLHILAYIISHRNPILLLPFADEVSSLLEFNNFQSKMMGLKILGALVQAGSINDQTKRKMEAVNRSYSKTIQHKTFRLFSLIPSPEFRAFTKYLTINLHERVEACSQIIGCKSDDLWAKIENELKKDKWNEKDEIKIFYDEWRDFSHPQGSPVIPFITTADLKVLAVLNEILDEVVEKSAFSEDQVEALWRILQPCDPDYNYSVIAPKPESIEPLRIKDKDEWFAELEKKDKTIERIKSKEEWITLFEKRQLAQDDPYHVPYRSYILMHSSLIRKGLICSYDDLDKEGFFVLMMKAYHKKEAITLSQAKEVVKKQTGRAKGDEPFLPIITWGDNAPFFKGYSDVLSLAGYLVTQYDLKFKGFDLYKEGELVVSYEVWNEGYEDNSYSRQSLSSGTRLQIRRNFLQQILDDYCMELCQSFFEKRQFYKKWHEEKPEEEHACSYFKILNS